MERISGKTPIRYQQGGFEKNEAHRGRSDQGVKLSADYLEAVRRVEALSCNQDGADKSWVHRAIANFKRHFESSVEHL